MARNYVLQHSDYDEFWQSRRRSFWRSAASGPRGRQKIASGDFSPRDAAGGKRTPWLHWLVIAAGLAIIAFFNLWPR